MKRILVAVSLVCGCSGVGVEQQSAAEARQRERADALTGVLSERSEHELYQLGLLDQYRERPRQILADLDLRLLRTGQRGLAYLLAEGCTLQAAAAEDPAVRERYLGSTVCYAWAYLFDPKLGPRPSPYDPRFRSACELYNDALARLIDLGQGRRKTQAAFTLPTLRKAVPVKPGPQELAWRLAEFERFETSNRYRPKGLAVINRSYGIGAPCIAIRVPPAGKAPERERYMPRLRQSHAATVLVRFHGTIRDRDRVGSTYHATAEVYDPTRRPQVTIGDQPVPLQADLTTPLAHFLGQAPRKLPTNLLDVEALERHRLGLYTLAPFHPDKIPVVFVHGLMSNPLTWMPMLNGLVGDPVLRARYQALFFFYPTGNPLLLSADLLRTSLDELLRRFDPAGKNPHLQKMILVGHSMGGVISRLQVQDSSKGELWKAASKVELEDLEIDDALRARAKRLFFFQPRPYVRRVVFLATPHRGSALAEGVLGSIGSAFVKLPGRILETFGQLGKAIGYSGGTTGIHALSPKNPVMQASLQLPIDRRVTYHSILGDTQQAGRLGGSDGVVPYSSAKLQGVASELIVRSDHSVQQTARAIAEVRRILRAHLKTSGD